MKLDFIRTVKVSSHFLQDLLYFHLSLNVVELRRQKLGSTEDLASPETSHSSPLWLRKTLLLDIKDINTAFQELMKGLNHGGIHEAPKS